MFDPIDGTVNYAHGMPIFCASLALEVNGRAEVGAVYDPTRRELFTAERGVGAWLNGRPLHVSRAPALIDAMLCTGFPYTVHQSVDSVVGLFGRFVGQARAVRRLGSAAIDLCYVAAGRLDGFWEQELNPWDTAAAALIVEEAGGRVTTFDGRPFQSRERTIVGSNGLIHDDCWPRSGRSRPAPRASRAGVWGEAPRESKRSRNRTPVISPSDRPRRVPPVRW